MYNSWNMQEDSMVRINISSDSEIGEWAVAGNADECLERFASLRDDAGVSFVMSTFLNFPKELAARKEYLQRFAETVIQRME